MLACRCCHHQAHALPISPAFCKVHVRMHLEMPSAVVRKCDGARAICCALKRIIFVNHLCLRTTAIGRQKTHLVERVIEEPPAKELHPRWYPVIEHARERKGV